MELLNEDTYSSSHESASEDDDVYSTNERQDRFRRARSDRDRKRSRSRSPCNSRAGDYDLHEADALIEVLESKLTQAKKKRALLAGEDFLETSGSYDLLIPKDKSDQFYEWLSGEISPEDAKRIKAYCLSPCFEGRSNSFVCPQLEIFFSRELKGKKPFEQLESDLKSIQIKHHEALRPLLFTWVNLSEEDDMLRQATADSIKHWCNVNYNLTNLRRKVVLKATDPGYVDLPNSTRPPLDVPGTSRLKLGISRDGPYRIKKSSEKGLFVHLPTIPRQSWD